MNGIEEILNKIGYDLKSDGCNYWRAMPIYRESANSTSLRISRENGGFTDFSANIKGSFYDLVRLSLGLDSLDAAKKWVGEEGYAPSRVEKKPKIILDKKVETKYVDGLMPHFSFYEKKGISLETLKEFECGVCFAGKQNNRFVFVIRDEFDEVKGVAGRDIIGGRVKWKLLGDKRKWVFPNLAMPHIEEKGEVFLVESIGDALALYDIGIKNVLVLFGVSISSRMVNLLSTMGLGTIIISTNNDLEKENNWGGLAAEGIKEKLIKVIDEKTIKIALPPNGDWGEMEKSERKEYVEKIRNN